MKKVATCKICTDNANFASHVNLVLHCKKYTRAMWIPFCTGISEFCELISKIPSENCSKDPGNKPQQSMMNCCSCSITDTHSLPVHTVKLASFPLTYLLIFCSLACFCTAVETAWLLPCSLLSCTKSASMRVWAVMMLLQSLDSTNSQKIMMLMIKPNTCKMLSCLTWQFTSSISKVTHMVDSQIKVGCEGIWHWNSCAWKTNAK